MADELEVLEKQQLSAQRSLKDLTDQLTLADHQMCIRDSSKFLQTKKTPSGLALRVSARCGAAAFSATHPKAE